MTKLSTLRLLFTTGFGGALVITTAAQSSRTPLPNGDESRLSKPTYKVRAEQNVRVRVRDGVELSTDVYRPDADGKFPALVMRTPYGKDWSAGISGGPYEHMFYAERGYVVVQQDSRGKYDSGGIFEPFRDEANDGSDTNDWIGRQPWSNGRIGGLGQSYYGLTQWMPAIMGSKYLTTIAPVMTTVDTYNNWIYSDGAFHLGFAMGWGTGLAGRGTVRPDPRKRLPTASTAASAAQGSVMSHLPLATMDEAQVRAQVPYYRDWMTHPKRDAYWTNRSPTAQLPQLQIPALIFTGWYDFFLRGALNDYVTIKKSAKAETARNGSRLIVGPWPHYTGPNGADRIAGQIDFGPAAAVGLRGILLRWYDYWLKGIRTGVAEELPVKIFVMGENLWRHEREWPLARTKYTKYYLQSGGRANSRHGDGQLSIDGPNGKPDVFEYNPLDPVPTVGGAISGGGGQQSGPYDQRWIEERQDVLVYTTPPLTQPVEVTGPITVKLYASTSAKDTDFTAKLVDVHPDGYARILQDGIIRARYRTSLESAQLVEPNTVQEYTIDLWATSNVFLRGHRIRLDISSSNFPRYDRNLNTGEDQATGTRSVKATQTIFHDAARSSHVVLPIVPSERPVATSP
jgi:putative CocE/NonD family hydrolase